MSDFVGVDIQGLPEVQRMLKNLPPEARAAAVDAGSDYLVNVLQQQPTPKHVSRRTAYPEVGGWFSEKQRKWWFANLNKGTVDTPYRRTQSLRRGWKKYGRGNDAIVANETPGAFWAHDDQRQARQLGLVGWQKISVIIRDHMDRLMKRVEGAAKRVTRKYGSTL
jgi:hypothetical protein